jgi:membrane protein
VVRRTTERAQRVVDDTSTRYVPARYLVLAYERFRRLNGSILAASIAFRVFLFLVPLTLILVGLAGYSAASGNDLDKDGERLGAALASTVAQAGNDSKRSWWVLILVGAATMLYTASSLFSTLSRSSAQLWEMWEYHPAPARQRLRFIAGLLITLAYLLLTRWIRSDLAVGIVLQVVSIAAHLVLAVLLLAFLPNRASHWRDLVPGALVTSVGLIGINVFTVVWLPHKLASLSETYGALGIAVATLSYLALVGYLLVASILTNVMWHEYRMSREASA